MDCSTPGICVHHQLLELTQTHVHWVGDSFQPSHSLLSPSPPAFNLSQHQGLFPMSQFFTSDGQSIGVSASASILPMNIQDWFPLGWTGWISLQSKRLSRRGKLGLVLIGRAMLSKSLTQFFVDEWGCVPHPPPLFTWGQTLVKVMKKMATSFKRSHACTAKLSAPNPAAGHHRPTPPAETPGHSL